MIWEDNTYRVVLFGHRDFYGHRTLYNQSCRKGEWQGRMKFNDVFDTDEVLAWYDGDPQDGTYYRSQEPSRQPFESDFYGVDDRDDRHEEIKKQVLGIFTDEIYKSLRCE